MGFGSPSKLSTAARAAAALGLLALTASDSVRVFRASDPLSGSDPFRGEGMLGAMLEELARIAPAGTGSPARALQAVRRQLAGPASVLLFSDLWDDEGLEDEIRDLAGARCETAVLRFLAPDEIVPALAGKTLLVDSESGRRHRLYIGDEERTAYRALLAEDDARWKSVCAKHQVPYVSVSSAVPATELVLVLLREAGVVK
jgi:uncharacterized protein (DUF58 family)